MSHHCLSLHESGNRRAEKLSRPSFSSFCAHRGCWGSAQAVLVSCLGFQHQPPAGFCPSLILVLDTLETEPISHPYSVTPVPVGIHGQAGMVPRQISLGSQGNTLGFLAGLSIQECTWVRQHILTVQRMLRSHVGLVSCRLSDQWGHGG